MNLFFLDFENVHVDGLKGLENLTNNDTVYLFYSKNTPHLPMEIVNKISNSKALFETIECKTGKNAMDFAISTYLGYKIKTYENKCNYYIVSCDKDYQAIVDFWEDWNISIVNDLSKATKSQIKQKKVIGGKDKKDQALRCNVGRVLAGYTKELKNKVVEIIETSKTNREVNNKLGQYLNDTKKAGTIYQKIKLLI